MSQTLQIHQCKIFVAGVTGLAEYMLILNQIE